MNTNLLFTVLRLLVLGVLVAGINVLPASVQVVQGTFTLPSATRWGLAMLPAGDYSFTLDRAIRGGLVTVYRGNQCVGVIPAFALSDTTSGRSEIVLENGIVREMSLPQFRVSLHYASPNPNHDAAPQEPQLAWTIPVTTVWAGR